MFFHIISLFPESLETYLGSSIIGRANSEGIIKIKYYNPRQTTRDKHRRTDLKPFGGGPGMVMMAEPIVLAAEKIFSGRGLLKKKFLIVLTQTGGAQFTNAYATRIAKKYTDIIFICGRYEGVDTRAVKMLRHLVKEKNLKVDFASVSIGPYVLTGGELAALVMIDATARQLPGVLGKLESLEETRVAGSEMYTRPEILEYRGKKFITPKVLLSGDHAKIESWRKNKDKKKFL